MNESSISVKIPVSLIELYKKLYDLPSRTTAKDVILYSIATSIPTKGMTNFIDDFKLDETTANKIIDKRDKYTKKANTEIREINEKIDKLTKQLGNSNTSSYDENKLENILNLLYLMSTEIYSASTDENEVASILNTARVQSLKKSIEKQSD